MTTEQQLDKIIQLLESIDKKLSKTSKSKNNDANKQLCDQAWQILLGIENQHHADPYNFHPDMTEYMEIISRIDWATATGRNDHIRMLGRDYFKNQPGVAECFMILNMIEVKK